MSHDLSQNTPCGFCGKLLQWSLTGELVHSDYTPICDSWHIPPVPDKPSEPEP